MPKPIYYADYLNLKQLLSSQHLESVKQGNPVHDELLFITIHQTHELWFKQILHELDDILEEFSAPLLSDKRICMILSQLHRITDIQRLLIDHIGIFNTMMPMSFLEFRELLIPASGFQSLQFRLIQIKLGLRYGSDVTAMPFWNSLNDEDKEKISEAIAAPSLFDRIENWLERTPFIANGDFNFWKQYQVAVNELLAGEFKKVKSNDSISKEEKTAQISQIEKSKQHFFALFNEESYQELCEKGKRRLSYKGVHAALFISIYHDYPVLQIPNQLLAKLQQIDALTAQWLSCHILLAKRMLGEKLGTGGSSGYQYLKSSAEKHEIFSDLTDLSIYLIPHSMVPSMSAECEAKLSFSYGD